MADTTAAKHTRLPTQQNCQNYVKSKCQITLMVFWVHEARIFPENFALFLSVMFWRWLHWSHILFSKKYAKERKVTKVRALLKFPKKIKRIYRNTEAKIDWFLFLSLYSFNQNDVWIDVFIVCIPEKWSSKKSRRLSKWFCGSVFLLKCSMKVGFSYWPYSCQIDQLRICIIILQELFLVKMY